VLIDNNSPIILPKNTAWGRNIGEKEKEGRREENRGKERERRIEENGGKGGGREWRGRWGGGVGGGGGGVEALGIRTKNKMLYLGAGHKMATVWIAAYLSEVVGTPLLCTYVQCTLYKVYLHCT